MDYRRQKTQGAMMTPSHCHERALRYEFDVEGHTIQRCGALDRTWVFNGTPQIIHKEGRKLCPHYGGKCPALKEVNSARVL